MTNFTFYKYEGLGNDFILFDLLSESNSNFPIESVSQLAKGICDRRFGIGGDGIILMIPSVDKGDVMMRIINSDGTEAEMCGNGIRCLANHYFEYHNTNTDDFLKVETLAGQILAKQISQNLYEVDMGKPTFLPAKIPTTLKIGSSGMPEGICEIEGFNFNLYAVGMGNPHLIVYVEKIDSIPFEILGKQLECHESFPANTNVHFVHKITSSKFKVKVWERGCGATLACGTGACAVLVASKLLNLSDSFSDIILPGGNLRINWPSSESSVYMTGPSNKVFTGFLSLKDLKYEI